MNLLHDINPGTKEEMNVIIETPRGSSNKYEIDKETGIIKLDRANYGPAPYPFEYGFIPKTYWDDGDALDVILLATFPIHPGILVSIRPIALMKMTDCDECDDKIIGVPVEDKRWDDVKDLEDLNRHTLREIKNFFETLKQLKSEDAVVTVHKFEDRKEAEKTFEKGVELYNKKGLKLTINNI